MVSRHHIANRFSSYTLSSILSPRSFKPQKKNSNTVVSSEGLRVVLPDQ